MELESLIKNKMSISWLLLFLFELVNVNLNLSRVGAVVEPSRLELQHSRTRERGFISCRVLSVESDGVGSKLLFVTV